MVVCQSVQLLSCVQLFTTLWTAALQASLSITNSRSLPTLISIESVMPSNHLILCRPLLLLPSIFPRIRVFSSESTLCIRWPNYWHFSFNVSPSNVVYTYYIYIYIFVKTHWPRLLQWVDFYIDYCQRKPISKIVTYLSLSHWCDRNSLYYLLWVEVLQ